MIGFLERSTKIEELFSAETANGVFTFSKPVTDKAKIKVQVTGANTANYKIKVKGSCSNQAPDFSATDSPTNPWSYVALKNTDSNTTVAGSTGVAVAADGTVTLEVVTELLAHIAVEISDYTSGDATCVLIISNNT